MQLTLLGTGSAIPTGRRAQTGYLVETGDPTVLVDCGAGVLQQLEQTDIGFGGVDLVLLSHLHLDHVTDLLPLLKARWLDDAGTLPIYGPPGTHDLLAGLIDAYGYFDGRLAYTVTEIEPSTVEIGDRSVAVHETEHSAQCFAYRFDGADGDLTLSGDSEASTELATFAAGSAVLVHDCSFPDDIEADNHAQPSALGAVLQEAQLGRVVLTHLYPQAAHRANELCELVGRQIDAPVDILPDGTTIVVQ